MVSDMLPTGVHPWTTFWDEPLDMLPTGEHPWA